MKAVVFNKAVLFAWDEKARKPYHTHDTEDPNIVHVAFKEGEEHPCSEKYYADLKREAIDMRVTMDIPDEKFWAFCDRLREKMATGMDQSEAIKTASDEIDEEWSDE